jgi:S-adenosylhomocysteine hydrolase
VNEKELWQKLVKQREKVKNLESKRFLLEKKEVKIMRLRMCIENIILAHTLSKKGSEVQMKQYNTLLTLERSTF